MADENKTELKTESKNGFYGSYSEFFRQMAEKFCDLPQDNIRAAYDRSVSFSKGFTLNPMIQNRRVKAISSLPVDYGKDKIADMLKKPQESEQALRSVSNILEYTAYPMLKLRSVYQNLLTYHSCVVPKYAEAEDVKEKAFLREWRMLEKFREEIQPKRTVRKIVGECFRDGKVFYVPRIEIDKSHNTVKSAYMQKLPQDWVKIAGFNNLSKYSVAFNMFYFLKPGTSYKQYGNLFDPFIDTFMGIFDEKPKRSKSGVIYASKNGVNSNQMYKLQDGIRNGEIPDNVEITYENKTWYYWVYLPADKVWTFEADDVWASVVSPFAGLFLSMEQIAQYEQVQLEIVQNPLVSMVLGQLETYDAVSPTNADPIKLSNTGRTFFQNLFYETMLQNNTGGVGIFSAPFKDMQLVQLAEAPNANQISSAGYEYAMEKSGMASIIPTTSEARAGVAQISLMIESAWPKHIYWQFERMMNVLMDNLSLKWEWEFRMFGSLADDDKLMKQSIEGMQRGILPDAIVYNALNDRSILDDLSQSRAVKELGIMELRLPLVTSYSASNQNPSLPPEGEGQPKEGEDPVPDKGGRPSNDDDMPSSDGQEQDADEGGVL